MKKFLLAIALAAVWPAAAHGATPPPYAGQCGIPAAQPVWAEFGYPLDAFNAVLGKPGIVIGVGRPAPYNSFSAMIAFEQCVEFST